MRNHLNVNNCCGKQGSLLCPREAVKGHEAIVKRDEINYTRLWPSKNQAPSAQMIVYHR